MFDFCFVFFLLKFNHHFLIQSAAAAAATARMLKGSQRKKNSNFPVYLLSSLFTVFRLYVCVCMCGCVCIFVCVFITNKIIVNNNNNIHHKHVFCVLFCTLCPHHRHIRKVRGTRPPGPDSPLDYTCHCTGFLMPIIVVK